MKMSGLGDSVHKPDLPATGEVRRTGSGIADSRHRGGCVTRRLLLDGIVGQDPEFAIWLGFSQMPLRRVIPHSNGAGTIDAVGTGVAEDRVGQRVWCYGAQAYRPFGTG